MAQRDIAVKAWTGPVDQMIETIAATLRNACHVAVGAPKGQRIRVVGMENLKPKR